MLTKNIFYRNFKLNNSTQKKKIIKNLKELETNSNQVYVSLQKNYKDSFSNQFLLKFKNYNNFKLIGMGGSILGAKAVYNFLEPKFKKFEFIDNFSEVNLKKDKRKKKKVTLVISKSGNTLETISNISIHFKNKTKNIFLTENKKNYLTLLAQKLKA